MIKKVTKKKTPKEKQPDSPSPKESSPKPELTEEAPSVVEDKPEREVVEVQEVIPEVENLPKAVRKKPIKLPPKEQPIELHEIKLRKTAPREKTKEEKLEIPETKLRSHKFESLPLLEAVRRYSIKTFYRRIECIFLDFTQEEKATNVALSKPFDDGSKTRKVYVTKKKVKKPKPIEETTPTEGLVSPIVSTCIPVCSRALPQG